jgi:hypothetical protein
LKELGLNFSQKSSQFFDEKSRMVQLSFSNNFSSMREAGYRKKVSGQFFIAYFSRPDKTDENSGSLARLDSHTHISQAQIPDSS